MPYVLETSRFKIELKTELYDPAALESVVMVLAETRAVLQKSAEKFLEIKPDHPCGCNGG
jgi:hypothetical protein